MSEQGAIVQPGIAPTARPTAGSMLAALHGELVPYAWHHPASEHDAYQLRERLWSAQPRRAGAVGHERRGWEPPPCRSGPEPDLVVPCRGECVGRRPAASRTAVPALRAGDHRAGRRRAPHRGPGLPASAGDRPPADCVGAGVVEHGRLPGDHTLADVRPSPGVLPRGADRSGWPPRRSPPHSSPASGAPLAGAVNGMFANAATFCVSPVPRRHPAS